MAYVVSEGAIANLDRPNRPRSVGMQLGTQTFTYGALWRAQPQMRTVVDFLARNIAQIGLHLFRRDSDTDRERLTDHPLAKLMRRPNPRTTRYRLIDSLVHDVGIYDRACWWKAKEGLIRLPPAMLEPIGDSWLDLDGVKLKGSRGSRDFGLDEVVLFRGYSPDGVWGTPPAETLRQTLLEEWNANQYRQQLWANGARIRGVIERPKGDWSPRAREAFRSDWQGLYTGDGPGAGGTPILEDGMKFVASGINPKDAEYVAARKLSREEVAAAYHVPLPMVGILEHATFSNIKEQHQQLYQDCLGPWLVMIQEELALQLVPDFDSSGDLYFEFNLAEKMRGTFEEQAAVLQTSVGGPWMTRNEARGRVNLPHIDGGDELIVPLNVITGGQASPSDSAPKSGDDLARIQAAIRAAIGGQQ